MLCGPSPNLPERAGPGATTTAYRLLQGGDSGALWAAHRREEGVTSFTIIGGKARRVGGALATERRDACRWRICDRAR